MAEILSQNDHQAQYEAYVAGLTLGIRDFMRGLATTRPTIALIHAAVLDGGSLGDYTQRTASQAKQLYTDAIDCTHKDSGVLAEIILLLARADVTDCEEKYDMLLGSLNSMAAQWCADA